MSGCQVDFYLLGSPSLEAERLACKLALMAWERGHRVCVVGRNDTQLETLDRLMWSTPEGRFLPHEIGDGHAAPVGLVRQPPDDTGDVVINLTETALSPPADWNALVNDPEVLLVDTRNDYECEIGTFRGALDPGTTNFRDFPEYVRAHLDPRKHRKVAMFCTGGIRCEKASAFMLAEGFDEVFHLRGGILNYLEQIPEGESTWEGECFVFDSRVAVNHRLEKGVYDQCYGCRHPITEDDKASPHYQRGVCCPRCYQDVSEDRKQRFAERQKQVELAAARQQQHIGAPPPARQLAGRGTAGTADGDGRQSAR